MPLPSAEHLPSATVPHDLVNEGLIKPGDVSSQALTDGIYFINTGAERVGSLEDGSVVLLTEHGNVPLQPGTLLNVTVMDENGVTANSHYIDEDCQLRDVLQHEDGSPYFPPVVLERMRNIAVLNAAILDVINTPSLVPMHELYLNEGWVLEQDPDATEHPSLANPLETVEVPNPEEPTVAQTGERFVGHARPVPPPDMKFTEADQRGLNTLLDMEDMLRADAFVVNGSVPQTDNNNTSYTVRSTEARGHRSPDDLLTRVAASAAALMRTVLQYDRKPRAGRHRK